MAARPTAVLGLLAMIAALALSGCGGTSTKTAQTTVSSSTTKARFVGQAEAICRTLSAQEKPLKARQEASKSLSVTASERAFIKLVGQLVSFSHSAEGKLRALPRPTAEAPAIEKLLDAFRSESADVAEIATSVSHQESAGGEAAAASLKRSVKANTQAAEGLGMKECLG